MKERPILSTPENAQKMHDGKKVQTRRTNRLDEVNNCKHWDYPQMTRPGIATFLDSTQANPYNNALDVKCPYGQVGDRLWIREAFCLCGKEGSKKPLYHGQCEEYKSLKPIWNPSLHMPRWACRTVVELTDIRVERVQEISEEDCIAEGVELLEGSYNPDDFTGLWKNYDRRQSAEYWNSPIDSYHSLWASINGQDSWAQNPFCWVLTFRKVDA